MKLRIKSPAKVNVSLRILNKREDGYHNIQSIIQMISLFDVLTFKKEGSGITLESNSKEIPLDSNNIIFRAAVLLKEKNKIKEGVSISIEKNIPVSAGLGGGSSNAAATLATLNKLWGLGYSMSDLSLIGSSLGSDVPFFLGEPAAFVEGMGEIVCPIKTKKIRWLILVNPGIKVSTSWAYNRFDEGANHKKGGKIWLTKLNKDNRILQFDGFKLDLIEISSLMQNDLEEITARQNRVIEEIKDKLRMMNAKGVMMSGSGPTVFGVFTREEEARSCSERLTTKGHWKVWVVKTLINPPF